jgi:molecular chaperone DnaJ
MQNSFFGSMVTVVTCPHCQGRGTIIREHCERCSGSGLMDRTEPFTIEVPPGIESGQHLEYQGQGDMSESGYPGSLYVRVEVRPHPRFDRDGPDLHYTLHLTYWQAALGDRVTVPLLDGETQITVPAGTQPGEEIVLEGKGLPRLRRRGRGRQIIHLQVDVPEDLTPQQREAIENLARAFGDDLPEAGGKGFFSRLRGQNRGA